jgi:hypothetical protein
LKPQVTLLTFADGKYRVSQQSLAKSAIHVGFSRTITLSWPDIENTEFWESNQSILTQPRGAGYWLWKPYIIRKHLEQCAPNDVLFYSDSALDGLYNFDQFPTKLVERVMESKQGFVIGPTLHQTGPLSRWCKRDSLILTGMDQEKILQKPMIQAGWNLWRNTSRAKEFLDLWLLACTDARALTDQPNALGLPNHPDFMDHRHDMSLLTLLAYRERVEVLDVANTGIFRLMNLRSRSEASHRTLKAPHNVERLLKGESAFRLMLRSVLHLKRLRRAPIVVG